MSLFAEEALRADFVEVPCEFCYELYPFELLMEHQSGCRPDLLHFNFDDIPSAPVATISPNVPPFSKTPEAIQQKSPDIPKAPVPSPISQGTNIASPGNQKKEDKSSTQVDPFKDLLKDDDEDEIPLIFEDNSQEVMSYGPNVMKRTEEEKPSFKPPPLPILNDQNENKDISNIISDDEESSESLEDFWRRADIKNTQRLRKLKI